MSDSVGNLDGLPGFLTLAPSVRTRKTAGFEIALEGGRLAWVVIAGRLAGCQPLDVDGDRGEHMLEMRFGQDSSQFWLIFPLGHLTWRWSKSMMKSSRENPALPISHAVAMIRSGGRRR
ncbi:hypothetical protein ABGB18_43910 [Nonomuraea sp. B12E4]|uniref:hypothetical protein n=1 Tax=Nonomuraea sp. B12E4 TaxID=3153564 RepID=UPI00325CD342